MLRPDPCAVPLPCARAWTCRMRYRRPSIAGVSILSMYPSMGGNNLKQALRHALVGRPLLARLSESASAAVLPVEVPDEPSPVEVPTLLRALMPHKVSAHSAMAASRGYIRAMRARLVETQRRMGSVTLKHWPVNCEAEERSDARRLRCSGQPLCCAAQRGAGLEGEAALTSVSSRQIVS